MTGASTAATSAPSAAHSFGIGFAHYGLFVRKCLSHRATLPLLAATTSAIAWSGHLTTIPLSLLAVPLLYRTQSRLQAFATLFSYYLGASWPLVPGARAFFGTEASALEGIFLWFGAATLLAIPAALLFAHDHIKLSFAIAGMFLMTALPPLGIIGWASPFLSAGLLFPCTSWFGLIGILGIIVLIGRFPSQTAALTGILALAANALYNPPACPTGWQAVNTKFGGAGQGDPDFLAEFDAQEQMQEIIRRSDARVLLFPEHVVTQWNEATEAFWHTTLESQEAWNSTILVGVGLPRLGAPQSFRGHTYYNVLIAMGRETQAVYHQRIPVPLGMWKPFSDEGVPLNLFGPGTIPIHNQRAAVLLCYEQLLVWPFISSAFEHPTVLVAPANDYWAKETPIPEIQKAGAEAWARLFGLPVLSAANQ